MEAEEDRGKRDVSGCRERREEVIGERLLRNGRNKLNVKLFREYMIYIQLVSTISVLER